MCPNGWKSSSIDCFKPTGYGRGAGYFYRLFDPNGAMNACTKENPQGCVAVGPAPFTIVYPNCKQGFQNFGCCVCNPICPAGTTEKGALCGRETLSFTTRSPINCNTNHYINAGLCYPACPPNFPDKCGALCVASGKCTDVTVALSSNIFIVGAVGIGAGACTGASGGTLTAECIQAMISVMKLLSGAATFIAQYVPTVC